MRPRRLAVYVVAALIVILPVAILMPNALGNFGQQGTIAFVGGSVVAAVVIAVVARRIAQRLDPDGG